MTGQDLATNALVPLPAGVSPDRLSFAQMLKRAEVFSRTNLVPEPLRGKPEAIVLVGARGAALGVPFELALQEIHVIKDRTFASAQLRLALIRRAGHEVRYVESSSERAVIKGRRKENRDDPDGWVKATWTIEDARTAGLTNKDVWKQFPADMLRARAAGALSRMEFSDVLLGMGLDLRTAEEAGAADLDVDEPGEAVTTDPSEERDDAGEVIEDAVVVEDLGPGSEVPPPTSTQQPPAPDEAPPDEPEAPPLPELKEGERADIAALKTRIRTGITPKGWVGLIPWLEACGIPITLDGITRARVGAIDAELDKRGVEKTSHEDPTETAG